jgi:CBS domain-containing protein
MSMVSDLLSVKGHAVHTIDRSATVFDAISKMVTENVGSLVVTSEDRPCGMITERDYLRKIAVQGRSSRTTFVWEIMSPDLAYVDSDTDVEDCMAIMTHKRIRHLPVLNGSRLIGIVSIGDVVKSIARERTHEVEELTAYVHGRSVEISSH